MNDEELWREYLTGIGRINVMATEKYENKNAEWISYLKSLATGKVIPGIQKQPKAPK